MTVLWLSWLTSAESILEEFKPGRFDPDPIALAAEAKVRAEFLACPFHPLYAETLSSTLSPSIL